MVEMRALPPAPAVAPMGMTAAELELRQREQELRQQMEAGEAAGVGAGVRKVGWGRAGGKGSQPRKDWR